ncbi:MAG: ribonuclease P protein subunit [Candidatus Bathyarchaeota archaeon]|jgi:ribonuclease P protein subunit POP4
MSPRTPRNILQHELIGLETGVIRSRNHSQIGISGKIVDESRKTLMIQQGNELKRVSKRGATFRLSLKCGDVEVEGEALYGRPEDRVKKKLKKRW